MKPQISSPSLAYLLAAKVILIGCDFELESGSTGERPDVRYFATSSYGCTLGGCNLNRPLMLGVEESIRVDIDNASAQVAAGLLVLESSDPSVLRLDNGRMIGSAVEGSRASYSFDARALAPGEVELSASVASQALDHFSVRVAAAVSIEATLDQHAVWRDAGHLQMHEGDEASLVSIVKDADGNELFANEAVSWCVAAPQVALVGQFLEEGRCVAEDRVFLEAISPGSTRVDGVAGDATRSFELEVLPRAGAGSQ